jgi:ATP-dependent RNA helicase DDX49/DBP8
LILNTSSGAASGGGGHILTLSATGSGKTAAFVLPLLHLLSSDPYGIYAIVLTPTRELAKQIQQQILALGNGSGWKITCALIIGGEDVTRQSLELSRQPMFVVATPGRLAELCRDDGTGLYRPNFRKVRFVILDEADRLLSAKSGFERDVAEVLLQSTTKIEQVNGEGKRVRRDVCRTLLFSATMTRSLKSLEDMAGAGVGRLPLIKVVVRPDGTWDDGEVSSNRKKKQKTEEVQEESESNNDKESEDTDEEDESSTPHLPAGLRQEYIFMPSRVREAYLCCAIRTLMTNGGRGTSKDESSGWNSTTAKDLDIYDIIGNNDNHENGDNTNGKSKYPLAQSAIIFVPTCERAAHISGILAELGIHNVALHSLLSQNRRLASLGTFQSQRVRVLVATDVASRGLDIPEVDLVLNAELPQKAVDYIHRVGRTARAGRRGRAVSLVGEQEVDLVHEAERISGRKLEKCEQVTDDMAVKLLGPVAKASRLTKMKLMDIGFEELVRKHRERKRRDRRIREKAERRARKASEK